MPLSLYVAVIPGAIETISAAEGKDFHRVLVIERTGVNFCFSLVACRSVHIKTSSKLIYGKIPMAIP